jgi:multidrug efflux pump subunit AcrB
VNLTRLSIQNPISVVVAVLLVTLFGVISLGRLPVQLTPELEKPEIKITTDWRAAAPEEVEAEIVEPQEKVLRGVPGATRILARARQGQAEITLTFAVGTNLQRALLEVLNRLNQVPRYPDDADEPIISSVGGDSRAIAWFNIQTRPANERPIAGYKDYLEEVVQTRFERVPGVALSEIFGGRESEVRITFDPYKAAALGVQFPQVARLAGVNQDISGGFAEVGKRQYTLRFAGRFSVDELGDMVLEWRDGRPIHLRDLAGIELTLADRSAFGIGNDAPSMYANAHREQGVNVLEVMAGLKQAATELDEGPLKRAGLKLTQVYDETLYIDRSVEMLRTNLGIGMVLAVGVLWWFLRRFRATLMVATAIPLCILIALMALDSAGRTLNVISLAGLALALGMVLDAGIVVLENIIRLREQGEQPLKSSEHGATQVWGALLASTATTVAIFLPVVFLEEEAGQLFGDLAMTIAVAVVASLLVAVTVIPVSAAFLIKQKTLHDPHTKWWESITDGVMAMTNTPLRRWVWILALVSVPLALGYWAKPDADYLPDGKRNLVFAFILPPPGSGIEYLEREMGQVMAESIRPYYLGEKEPRIRNYFFVAFPRGVFMGARSADPTEVGEVERLINGFLKQFPDTIGFARRASLFGGLSGSNAIDLDIQSRDIIAALDAARAGFVLASQHLPGARIRPFPGLDLAEPEIRLLPDERRIAEVGWDRGTLAGIIRAVGDGLYVGDYFDGEQKRDIILRAEPWELPEDIGGIPFATPRAGVVPLGELVDVARTAGPNEIRRVNRRRTVTLQINPPDGMPLERAISILRERVAPMLESRLPEDGVVEYRGSADKLAETLEKMSGSFLLAVAILYLLMSALFRSFLDSLLVLLVIPMASIGGILALQAIDQLSPQPMDLLTMIGFVILLGLVVNNAILLVHQTRQAEREGAQRREAVRQAVRLRLRPILMSTLTSMFGMLPLMLLSGAGTELYRGLATVIVGGLTVSTLFTLVLLPSLLRLGESRKMVPMDSQPASVAVR